jgi:hypothetical protein
MQLNVFEMVKSIPLFVLSFGLLIPALGDNSEPPRGSYLSTQFAEARAAAKAQGKALVYIETDSKSTCPKTQWGTAEAYSALKKDYILVVEDDAIPECKNVALMNAAINQTVKIGNNTPRITIVEPGKLKFITGADYGVLSENKRWEKEVEEKVAAAMKPSVETLAVPDVPKTETPRDWTNLEGKTIRGTLVEQKENSVVLKLESGKTVEYPLDKLSAETKASLPKK